MIKTILIELAADFVAARTGDTIAPIENLKCKLQKLYTAGLSFSDESATSVKVGVDTGVRLPATVVRTIRKLFAEAYTEEATEKSLSVSILADTTPTPPAAETPRPLYKQNAEPSSDEPSNPENSELKECQALVDQLIGAEDFKALVDELTCIAPQILRNKTYESLTNQVYLFSINEGYGCSTCLTLLGGLLHTLHLRNFNPNRPVIELKLPSPKGESEEPFEEAYKQMTGKDNAVRLIGIDISEWLNDIDSRAFKSFLFSLSRKLSDHVIVFRIPFVEKDVLEKVKHSLGDLMSVRDVSFPPLTKQEIRLSAEKALDKYGFSMTGDAWECFHNRITEEKSDGKFYGLNTIQKVVRELIYHKQLHNAKGGKNDDLCITKEDALAICPSMDGNAESGMEMLSRLVGGDAIRARVEEILSQIELARVSNTLTAPCIHMRFVGNPGTGKTTVARIIGKILKERGVLRVGNFYEYAGRDFCGRYIGETAPKTASMCRDAYGSVLFIDEAYSLYRGDGNDRDFGREALETLIAEMENHRNDLVVIMAGYTDDMEQLMKGNAGLASRMPYVIEFPNFNRDELYRIYLSMLEGQFQYEEDLLPAVRAYFDELPDAVLESKEFSNARFVRNLFERTWAKAAMRCQLDKISTITLTRDDFERSISDKEFTSMMQKKKAKLGFGE